MARMIAESIANNIHSELHRFKKTTPMSPDQQAPGDYAAVNQDEEYSDQVGIL